MKSHPLGNQRGSVLLFTTVMLVLLFVFGGIAIDLTYFGSVRRELQRSMDAASLAGAGNLGFNATVFPVARLAAQNYASLNNYSDPAAGVISLALNNSNDPAGEIVLGIWDGANFTPSLDGSQVNAVLCQYATSIPTSFLQLLGIGTLPVSASAIAVTYPPAVIPPTSCVFPMALSCCAFGGCQSGTSSGCGAPVTFITSSGKTGDDCLAPPCTNTAGWANLCSTATPNASYLKSAIEAAESGNCEACNIDGSQPIGTNNGMIQAAFDTLEKAFLAQYGGTHEVKDSDGNMVYAGPGWKVLVPVIQTDCPPQEITGTHDVIGWTEFVITAVVNHGQCIPSNPADPNLPVNCPNTGEPALRGVFGYYKCAIIDSPPSVTPGPGPALATNLRLVK